MSRNCHALNTNGVSLIKNKVSTSFGLSLRILEKINSKKDDQEIGESARAPRGIAYTKRNIPIEWIGPHVEMLHLGYFHPGPPDRDLDMLAL